MDIFVHFSFVFVVFFDNFACVNANCINFGSGVYFYWNFNIPPSFPFRNLFCTRYKKIVPLCTFWTKMSSLKPIKTAIFNRSAV